MPCPWLATSTKKDYSENNDGQQDGDDDYDYYYHQQFEIVLSWQGKPLYNRSAEVVVVCRGEY